MGWPGESLASRFLLAMGALEDAVEERGAPAKDDGDAAAQVGNGAELADDRRAVPKYISRGDGAADRH
jgi:hypothetical protein